MAGVLVGLLALLALAFVAAPLRAGPRGELADPSSRIAEAEGRKRAALTAILDIENERDVGKLSETDFEALRADYQAQALAALSELDALNTSHDDDVEAEIAAIKARLQCPSCGALRPTSGACPQCGE